MVFIGNMLTQRQVHGPSNLEGWTACWKVFESAAFSLKIASPAACKVYRSGLKALLREYPHAWPLVFVADNICREEQWPRLHLRLEQQGRLDPHSPWSTVLQASAYSGPGMGELATWWHNHIVARRGA